MDTNLRTAFFASIIGGTFIWLSVQGWISDMNSSVEPQVLTCAHLSNHGPGSNLHVVLHDCEILNEYVKVDQKDEIWLEAAPLKGEPKYKRIFLKTFFTSRLDVRSSKEHKGIVRRASSFHMEGKAMNILKAEDPWVLVLGDYPGTLLQRIVTLLIGLGILGYAAYCLRDWRDIFR